MNNENIKLRKFKFCINLNSKNLIRDDDFISIEIYGLDWFNHSKSCKFCKEFFKDLQDKNIDKWVLSIGFKNYKLKNNTFESIDNHYSNHLSVKNHYKTMIKLKKDKDITEISNIKFYEDSEEYEICYFLKKTLL